MKFMRSLYWLLFTVATLLLASLYIPLFWYLTLRGKLRRKEELAWGFTHWWGKVVLRATGSTVKIIGTENIPQGSVVVMSNHQSYFDVMLMLGYIDKPIAFIAKKELKKYPLISHWMGYVGCIFLDRKDVRQAVKVFQQAVDRVKSGWSMVIFPEGTRSGSATMGEFKRGSMKLPIRAGVPIVPVSINRTYKVYEGNGKWIGSAEITMVISPAIPTNGLSDSDSGKLADMVKESIVTGLLE